MPIRILLLKNKFKRNVKQKFDLLTTAACFLGKGPSRERKLSTSTGQQERGKAKEALRNCGRQGFISFLDRWNREGGYRESQINIGRKKVKAWGASGSDDHTNHAKKEERKRYRQIGVLGKELRWLPSTEQEFLPSRVPSTNPRTTTGKHS